MEWADTCKYYGQVTKGVGPIMQLLFTEESQNWGENLRILF